MHEVSLVADLVEVCALRSRGRPVELVRVRHATTIPADVLVQAFRMLTETGPLAGAALETEAFDVILRCGCGFDGPLGHDDMAGSMAVCPQCGELSATPRTAELELLEVVATD